MLKQYGVINLPDENIKRVSLYFNVNNPVEKELWEYLEAYGKKNECIRNALYQYIHQNDITYVKKPKEIKKKTELSKEETSYIMENLVIE